MSFLFGHEIFSDSLFPGVSITLLGTGPAKGLVLSRVEVNGKIFFAPKTVHFSAFYVFSFSHHNTCCIKHMDVMTVCT